MLTLRPYQQECIDAIPPSGRYLISLPTGSGKSVIFSQVPTQGKMLIVSHREELVRQPLRYFDCATSVEMASNHADQSASVISASVQSLYRRVSDFSPDLFDVIVVDEAHHSPSPTYRKIIDHFNPRLLLGFTATPNRSDSVRMDDIYEKIIFKRDLRWGIEQGWLSDIFCRRAYIGFDLSAVRTRMGDFAPGELDKAMDGTADAIAQAYKDYAVGSTLIFAVSVRHAQEIANRIDGAVVVTGETSGRPEIVKSFTEGKIPCIVNCMVFTEGTDIPRVETIIIARPTQSDSLYTQMVGRGLRPFAGKEHLNLIDCVGVTGRASLCTAPSLLGIDISAIPEPKQSELEGELFALPEKVDALSDCPESWIKNIKIVDLWSQAQRYELHSVNYFKMPNGDLVVSLPERQSIRIPCQDELGRTVWRGQNVPMQDALDGAYMELCTRFAQHRTVWDLSAVKRWGKSPASEKQIKIIQRRVKRFDPKGLNKMEASAILNRLFTK